MPYTFGQYSNKCSDYWLPCPNYWGVKSSACRNACDELNKTTEEDLQLAARIHQDTNEQIARIGRLKREEEIQAQAKRQAADEKLIDVGSRTESHRRNLESELAIQKNKQIAIFIGVAVVILAIAGYIFRPQSV